MSWTAGWLENYTVQDAVGVLRGVGGFSLLLLVPGSLLAWGLDLFEFRRQSLPARVAWSLALSFAVTPILLNLAGRVGAWEVLLGGLWALAGVWLVLVIAWLVSTIVNRRTARMRLDRYGYAVPGLMLLGALLVAVELIDVQVGRRIYLSVTVVDQAYRVGFTNALFRGPVPPLNPFYHPGHAEPLRYFYFWYALCAMCMRIAHVTARQALVASSVWVSWGLTALLALLVRYFLGGGERSQRRILAAVLLLGVTGADLIPVLFLTLREHQFMGEIEWWSRDQISSWMDCILWVPHHTAALLCCLTAFVLLWRTREDGSQRERAVAVCLAGVAAASSFGLSIYVAAGFALLMLAWLVRLLVWERDPALAGRVALSATLAAGLLAPYVHEMVQAQSGTQAGAGTGPWRLLSFGVREFAAPQTLLQLPRLAGVRAAHPFLFLQAVRLLFLVPGYALELGFYAVVLVLFWRRRRSLDPARSTALFFSVCGLLMVSFIRSGVIENNDFGYRAAMLPCIFLLLLGTDLLLEVRERSKAGAGKERGTGWTVALSRRLLLLGAVGTAYQAFELRCFLPLLSAAHRQTVEGLPEATYAARRAYGNLPPVSARGREGAVQFNIEGDHLYLHLIDLLYSNRPMIVDAASDCGAVFGGDPGPCARMQQEVRALFSLPGQGSEQARAACREWGARYLTAYSSDPVWQAREGWVWSLPLAATDAVPGSRSSGLARILDCGMEPGQTDSAVLPK